MVDPPGFVGGHLRTRQITGHLSVELVSNRNGCRLLGPLLDPRLVCAEPDGLVLAGTESDAQGAYLEQEWQLTTDENFALPADAVLW